MTKFWICHKCQFFLLIAWLCVYFKVKQTFWGSNDYFWMHEWNNPRGWWTQSCEVTTGELALLWMTTDRGTCELCHVMSCHVMSCHVMSCHVCAIQPQLSMASTSLISILIFIQVLIFMMKCRVQTLWLLQTRSWIHGKYNWQTYDCRCPGANSTRASAVIMLSHWHLSETFRTTISWHLKELSNIGLIHYGACTSHNIQSLFFVETK